MTIDRIMRMAPVIPVMVIEDVKAAVPLARALVGGGLKVLEITLRTPAALDAITQILGEVEDAVVGAGTVLDPAQLEHVAKIGCAFAVSPGFTPALLDAAATSPCPLLPGAASASEVMQLLERGYDRQKFFPAEGAGGTGFLKSIASPLPAAKFCPTGGIGPVNAKAYLALPNVLCVGGSWVVPKEAIMAGKWDVIACLSSEACRLRASESSP
ncbi:MAG: bifunctional 4-hydroxy-2-oxoglutarate aldolase/2-dehydro-3-deoxy-phosphogluconate aldolase [Geminicoccaceae bacterium]